MAQDRLQAGLIVAGWDKREGGCVYALPLGGTLIKVPFSIGEACEVQQVGSSVQALAVVVMLC